MRILLAEDDSNLRGFIAETLTIIGGTDFEVATVKNGSEAVEYILQNQVDVLVTDIRMYPSKNGGIDAIRMIRQFCKLPIIVLSAYDDSHTRQVAMDAGATTFIKKPPHLHRLAVMIRRYGEQYRNSNISPSPEIKEKTRRLQLLKIQQAKQGDHAPPHVITEIEDLERELNG